MELLRFRDAVSIPGLLSLSRVPLAVAFPFAVSRPALALAVLLAAALSDVMDGWYARRSGHATVTGAVLDPVMDKVFVTTVAVTLVVAGRLSLPMLVLLAARDVLELPLAGRLACDRKALADQSGRVGANVVGKVATVTQFMTVAAAVLRLRYTGALAVASGVLGITAATTYWLRVLQRSRRNGTRGVGAAMVVNIG